MVTNQTQKNMKKLQLLLAKYTKSIAKCKKETKINEARKMAMVMTIWRDSRTLRERRKVGAQNEMLLQNANLENLCCWSGMKTSWAFPRGRLHPSGLPNSLPFNSSYTFVMNKLFQKSLRVKPPTVLKDM